jgi:integrase
MWIVASSRGSDGQRITRGTLQYRAIHAFKKAGLNGQRARGVLVHGFRHTFATELANGNVGVYALMKRLPSLGEGGVHDQTKLGFRLR